MKLTARIIVKKLEEKYPVVHGKTLSDQPCLGRPVFYTGQEQALSNHLYIMNNVSLQTEKVNFPKTSFIIFVGKRNDTIPEYLSNICVIDCGVDADTVFNDLQNIFNSFDDWYEALLRSRLEEESIHRMLEISLPIFHNPLVVIGMDFVVTAKAGDTKGMFNEPVFGSTDETYGHLNKLKKDEMYNSVRESDGAFFYPNQITGISTLCVNIKKHGLTTHRLMMLDTLEPIDTDYGFLLETLATMVEHALSHKNTQNTDRDKSLHSVLSTILTDRTADYVTTSQRLDTLGWFSRNEYLCVVLQITNLDQQNLTENSICSYVENAVSHSCAFPHKRNIVIFVNVTKAQMTLNDISERLIYFIRDSYFKAGYSRVMVGHFNLRRQYLQSIVALELGERKMPSIWSHRFNEIAFDYILEQSTRRLPGYMISHEKLLRLKDIDEFQNTEYMHTLRLYLDNHLNAVKTAKDLFIHRSTFLYRLEKIKSLLETTLEDPEEILYLMLSFRFIEMEEKTDNKSIEFKK